MESDVHMDYVRWIMAYIGGILPRDACAFIEADLPESPNRPIPVINGYRPDVYLSSPQYIVIGEAKTLNDVRNRHTQEQIVSYVSELKTHNKNRHLVVCTSLLATAELKNMIRRLSQKYDFSGIRVHCINDLGVNISVWDF